MNSCSPGVRAPAALQRRGSPPCSCCIVLLNSCYTMSFMFFFKLQPRLSLPCPPAQAGWTCLTRSERARGGKKGNALRRKQPFGTKHLPWAVRFHPHANPPFHSVLGSPSAAEGTGPVQEGNTSPVVILEQLLVDGVGQGEAGCQQPHHSDAQRSLRQRHPLLQRVQDDLRQRRHRNAGPADSRVPCPWRAAGEPLTRANAAQKMTAAIRKMAYYCDLENGKP